MFKKELTSKDFAKAPWLVNYIKRMENEGKPCGDALVKEARYKHPEYFE